ncbi:MAG: D-sedoheptulose 7-phosphate isomerase [Candidatus Kapabacteria bacterium]|nr:D-sedoheptulose 7-phosphate isomerase [Candidatus Kapabacteria bacterium]
MYDIKKLQNSIRDSISVKEELLSKCSNQIFELGQFLAEKLRSGGKIMFCGNGGSAADCQHLAAELVVRLRSNVNRPALAAIALTVDPSIMTAGGNDIGFDNVFARSVEALGRENDVLIGISTSGNSENIIRAFSQAKLMGISCVALLGGVGGKMKNMTHHELIVPSAVTARVQESHILIGHIWCEMIEEILFPAMFD